MDWKAEYKGFVFEKSDYGDMIYGGPPDAPMRFTFNSEEEAIAYADRMAEGAKPVPVLSNYNGLLRDEYSLKNAVGAGNGYIGIEYTGRDGEVKVGKVSERGFPTCYENTLENAAITEDINYLNKQIDELCAEIRLKEKSLVKMTVERYWELAMEAKPKE